MTTKTALPTFSVLAFAAALAAAPDPAAACGMDAYLGQVCVVATSFCPTGTMEASGQMLQTSQYPALFTVMGCSFGGDCRTTFRLPDLRGRMPVQYGQGPGLAMHPFGQAFGQETVTQTVDMIAPHTHTVATAGSGAPPAAAPGTVGNDAARTSAGPSTPQSTAAASGGASGTGTIAAGITGGGASIPIVPPQLAMRYCVVTSGGAFPDRK